MREQLEVITYHCRQRLAALDAAQSDAADELRVYEAMLKVNDDELRPEVVELAIRKSLGNLSPTWLAILSRLCSYKSFRPNDVVLVARDLNKRNAAIKQQTLGNARFQLHAYTKRGLLERRGGGNYRLNEKSIASLALVASVRSHKVPHRDFDSNNNGIGPELQALAQERRVTPANPRLSKAQHERG